MTFSVLSEREVVWKYNRAATEDKRYIVGVLADLTGSRYEEREAWLTEKGVWVETKRNRSRLHAAVVAG
jgi:hypothetical protein